MAGRSRRLARQAMMTAATPRSDGLGDMAAGMATSRAIFSIAMPSSDSSETNVCRRSRGAQSLPSPARSQTSWNIFRICLAPSGVPVAVVNTLPVSCQCDPAASRSAAWSTCHSLSAPTAICASFSARRDLGVFVSPPARSARSTATDGGLPSRSTSSSHPIARASSGAHASHQAHNDVGIISEAGRRGSFSPACRSSAGGARRRRTARPGGRRGCGHGPWAPFPVREHAPVVPGCGYLASD